MKKVLVLMLSLLMAMMCLAGCGASSGNAGDVDGNVIKIGVFEPATGPNGAGGKQEVLGIKYANEMQPTVEINGEEYAVELVEVDNESDNSKAVTAAQSLVSSDVSVVLGSYGSGVSIAAGSTFKDAGIPAIGISCTNQQVTSDCDVYFRICFLDPFQGKILASYAYENGMRKAYCLSQLGDDYSVNLVGCFQTAFEELGGEVVKAEQFQVNNTNFNSFIENAKSAGADVFFSPVDINSAQYIIDQADALSLNMPILAGDTWDNNKVAASAKDKGVEVTCSTFFAADLNDEAATFDTNIKEWINSDSDRLTANGDDDTIAAVTALGYDAYNVALEAIKAAGSADPADILAALPGVTYTGITGSVAFDELGDVAKDSVIFKTIDTASGTWKFLKEQQLVG